MDTTPATPPADQAQVPDLQTQAADFVLSGFMNQVPQPIQVPPAAEVEKPAAETPAAEASTEAPATENAEEAKEEPSPYDDLIGEKKAPAPLAKEVVEALKARGIEDLDKVLTERTTLKEQLGIRETRIAEMEGVLKVEATLDPLAQELIKRAREGQDVISWVKAQASVDILKPAEKISKLDLVKAYHPEGFTPEEWAAFEAKDDAELLEQLKPRLDSWHKLAVKEHEAARQAPLQERALRQAQEKADIEAHERAVAANISYIKEHAPSMSALITSDVIKDLQDLSIFTKTFCEADGKTLKPSAAYDLFIARDHKAILQRAVKSAELRGEQRERLRMAQRLPATAEQANTARKTPAEQTAITQAQDKVLEDLQITR